MSLAGETFERRDATAAAVLIDAEPRAPRAHLVVLRPASNQRRRTIMQRELNVLVALIALILTLPMMLVVAIAIKLTSPGPIFYKQIRVGLDRRRGRPGGNFRRHVDYGGKLFTMYKFRTMYVQPPAAEEVWASEDDPRVTRVGRILRSFRIDELPQLYNVLKGDMNVVGPRPEQPNIFVKLRGEIDGYDRRQEVLPGITGVAQINHHYGRNLDDVKIKLRYDLAYAARQSALEDARTMLRTLPVVFFRRGGW